jgi:hypothetical protein
LVTGLHVLGGERVVGYDAFDIPVLDDLGKSSMRGLAHPRRRQGRQPVGMIPVGAPPEVSELDHDLAVVLVAAIGEFAHPRHHFFAVGENVAEGRRAVFRYQRRSRGHGHRQPGLGARLVVQAVALLRHAVLGIGGLMRGSHEPVLQGQVLELKRLQQWIVGRHRIFRDR